MAHLLRLRSGFALALTVFIGSSSSLLLLADDAPRAPDVFVGQSLTLRADVEGGQGPFHFQWSKDYAPIIGATNTELKFESLVASDSGSYAVTVFNDGGSVTSALEIVTVKEGEASRLANISVISTTSDTVVVGFALGGANTTGAANVLARAAGPALAQLGVAGGLPDPVLSIFSKGRLISTNDDWGGDAGVAAVAAAVGAFPFSSSSKDSAVNVSLPSANYTAEVSDSKHGAGITIIELYDVDAANPALPRLLNVSARAPAGRVGSALVAGFTVQGEGPIKILLRGVGPALTALGVDGVLEDPKLVLMRGETLVSVNDNWGDGNATAITDAVKAVGAFALPDQSRDAAIVVKLMPGSYTAQLSSANGTGGVGLIELYEVP